MKKLLALTLSFLLFLSACGGGTVSTSSDGTSDTQSVQNPIGSDTSSTTSGENESLIGVTSNPSSTQTGVQNPSENEGTNENSSSAPVSSEPPTQNTSSNEESDDPQDPSVDITTGNYAELYPKNLYYTPLAKDKTTRYVTLTGEQQRIFRLLDTAAYNMQTEPVALGECVANDIYIAYFALLSDRPEYFWLPTRYGISNSGKNYSFNFTGDDFGYLYSKSKREEIESEIAKDLENFNKNYVKKSGLSEYEREMIAHDFIVSMNTYDKSAAGNSKDLTYKYAWNIVGPFTKGKSVCEGYTKSMALLLNMLGIENRNVIGTTSGPHMWNLVKISGKWYHLDLTANDSRDVKFHSCFNLSDSYIKTTHKADSPAFDNHNYKMPTCTSNDSNYFYLSGNYLGNHTETERIAEMISKEIKNGKNQVEIFFTDPSFSFTSAVKNAIELEEILNLVADKTGKRVTSGEINGFQNSRSCIFKISYT